jgi:hypothetical protein
LSKICEYTTDFMEFDRDAYAECLMLENEEKENADN